MQANDRRIFLVGLPGAGKTTLGKELAQQINMPFIDLDQAIVEHTGKNITQLFNELGEEGFRAIEHQNFESGPIWLHRDHHQKSCRQQSPWLPSQKLGLC